MDLYAVIDQVVALLQQRGRLTYRAAGACTVGVSRAHAPGTHPPATAASPAHAEYVRGEKG
jgi:hypothetical protein